MGEATKQAHVEREAREEIETAKSLKMSVRGYRQMSDSLKALEDSVDLLLADRRANPHARAVARAAVKSPLEG
jgi:hypothetical protein